MREKERELERDKNYHVQCQPRQTTDFLQFSWLELKFTDQHHGKKQITMFCNFIFTCAFLTVDQQYFSIFQIQFERPFAIKVSSLNSVWSICTIYLSTSMYWSIWLNVEGAIELSAPNKWLFEFKLHLHINWKRICTDFTEHPFIRSYLLNKFGFS